MKLETTESIAKIFAATKSVVKDDVPRVVVSGNFATPYALLDIFDANVAKYRVNALNPQGAFPDRDGAILETSFVGPGMRGKKGLCYYPSRLSLVPRMFKQGLTPSVVIAHTSMPVDGKVSLGIEVNVVVAAIEACKAAGGIVVAQMNPKMPYTFGDAEIPVETIDYGVEIENELPSPVKRPIDEISDAIGEKAASLIPDGATIQLGIGAVPDACLARIASRKGLRLWSEMFSDGLLDLRNAGALDADHKITASFAFGSRELYDFMDKNPGIEMDRTETTNAPSNIAKQRMMHSVNTALQVDLYARANAARIKGRGIFSGFGGQTDFIVGALNSDGGKAIMALASWHPKADVSTVVPQLEVPSTSFQHSFILTEQGIAQIYGRCEVDQAHELIHHAANPRVRDDLEKAAIDLGIGK